MLLGEDAEQDERDSHVRHEATHRSRGGALQVRRESRGRGGSCAVPMADYSTSTWIGRAVLRSDGSYYR